MIEGLPPFIASATLPQWITAGSLASILYIIVYRNLGLKKLAVEADQVQVNARTAANAENADIRDHYAEELARVVQRQHECEEREAQLRVRVAQLENDILGLIRIITQASADKVIALGDPVSGQIRDMAERIQGRTGK